MREFVEPLRGQPGRSGWVVAGRGTVRPTPPLLLRAWLGAPDRPAILVPAVHTVESLVEALVSHDPSAGRPLAGDERNLRRARAWYDAAGRNPGPGLLGQFDHFVRDWQRCGLDPPYMGNEPFDRLVEQYLVGLESDGCRDTEAGFGRLLRALGDPESGPARWAAGRFRHLVFDGFHRLDRAEADLVAALAGRSDVLLWLTGVRGQPPWSSLDRLVSRFKADVAGLTVVDLPEPASVGPIPGLGRRLFPAYRAKLPPPTEPVPGVFQLSATTPGAEAEAAARRVKADVLDDEGTGRRGLKPHDIAVVVPGSDAVPLVLGTFRRFGVPCGWRGAPVPLSTSRPAGVLAAALEVVRGNWRPDLVLDFLTQPLVLRRLSGEHRLHDLFERRPQARRRLDFAVWTETWARHLRGLRAAVDAWKDGTQPLPERAGSDPAQFLRRRTDLIESLTKLIESARQVLTPVAAMDGLLEARTANRTPLRDLVEVCLELLAVLRIDAWLSPADSPAEAPEGGPWRAVRDEFRNDQQAYVGLLGTLRRLAGLPPGRLACHQGGGRRNRPDLVTSLRLALAGETFQPAGGEDGVRLLRADHLETDLEPGRRFRQVYVLGLVEGLVPAAAETGALATRRRLTPALAEQVWQRDAESVDRFRRLFELADERLVVSCPVPPADRRSRRSPFLAEVERLAVVPVLAEIPILASPSETALELGRATARGETLTDLWPTAGPADLAPLAPCVAALAARHRRRSLSPTLVRVDSPALLGHIFTDGFSFSPSQLETYAACPFRYFGTTVLRLEEREADQTRIHYGSMVHRVLQRFYETARERLGLPDGEPLPPVSDADRPRLLDLFREEWGGLDDGTLPPDLDEMFACRGGVLDLFLTVIERIEGRDADFGNLVVEYPLSAVPLGEDAAGRPVRLTGTVDRVDVHRRDRGRAIIIDYKTGQLDGLAARQQMVADGRMLQLPLYAAALAASRSDLRAVGGAYIHLNERQQGPRESVSAVIGASGVLPEAGGDRLPFDPEGARKLALTLAGDIRAGNFSLTRHGVRAEHPECTSFCPLRHACRHPDGYTPRRGF